MGSLYVIVKKYYALCIVHYVLCCVVLVSCDGPSTIPEAKLESIITEVLLVEGVRGSGLKFDTKGPSDSIDFYSPVLNKHGYSVADFRYTINSLASRKSNPLEAVMERVVATIDKYAIEAQRRYDIARRYDSLALRAFADTVYRLDSTLVGSLRKFRIRLDSIKAGDYKVTMDYRSMLDYRLPQKSIKYYFAQAGDKKPAENTVWMSRVDDVRQLDETFTAPKDRDSLIVYFSEAAINRYRAKKEAAVKDTSFIANIAIVYTPPIAEARERYYTTFFGEDFVVFSDFRKINEQQLKKDSLPGPIGLPR